MLEQKRFRDGPLENLWEGRAKYKKKIAQGKIKWKKILARQLIQKNIHAKALKKFLQGIWWRKKIPAARKFPSPPITFLMVRPLTFDRSRRAP